MVLWVVGSRDILVEMGVGGMVCGTIRVDREGDKHWTVKKDQRIKIRNMKKK